MDQLKAIQYFIKVAELGSFSEAARTLGVPASSISRRLRDLEEDLGVTLVSRTTRVVRLTELGQLYLERIRPTVDNLRYANELVKNHHASPSGLLRISAITGYGEYRLVPALRRLRQRYPELVVDLDLTDQLSDLTSDEIDIAVRVTAHPPERAIARRLNSNNFVLVAAPSYLDRYGYPRRLDDLLDHKTLLYRGPGNVVYWQAKTEKGWLEVKTKPTYICNIGKELVAEAEAGHGLAMVPSWGVREQVAEGRLRCLRLDDCKLALSRNEDSGTYLLYHQPKHRLAKIKVAVDFLVEELTEDDDALMHG